MLKGEEIREEAPGNLAPNGSPTPPPAPPRWNERGERGATSIQVFLMSPSENSFGENNNFEKVSCEVHMCLPTCKRAPACHERHPPQNTRASQSRLQKRHLVCVCTLQSTGMHENQPVGSLKLFLPNQIAPSTNFKTSKTWAEPKPDWVSPAAPHLQLSFL